MNDTAEVDVEVGEAEPGYRIGAVTRLTGIQPDTLRMWERRYKLVVPRRTGTASRLYSHQDIARLSLIKTLVDGGQAIGSIAHLTLEQLQGRVGVHGVTPDRADAAAPKVAVLGDTLSAQFSAAPPRNDNLDWVWVGRDREQFTQAARAAGCEVVVIELPTVMTDAYTTVQRLLSQSGAAHAVIVYGFGTRKALRQLAAANFTILRAPAGPEDLRAACLRAVGIRLGPDSLTRMDDLLAEPAPRHFSAAELALAASFSTKVECECPRHLADIVSSLNAFEDYSASCVNRDNDDALLHTFLHTTTSQARALMERALERVARAEGIPIGREHAHESVGKPT